MPKKLLLQLIASGIAIALLVALVTASVAWMSADSDYFGTAVSCNLLAIFFAIAAWTKVLRKKDTNDSEPLTT